MATLLTAWNDDVVPFVRGAPLAFVLQKIREAAVEYCRGSKAWRYLDQAAIDAVASQQTYLIVPPAGTIVVHVFQVNFSGQELGRATPEAFKAKSATWFSDTGTPEMFTLFNEGKVSLLKIPSANAVGAIRVPDLALAPAETATEVDDSVFANGRVAIAVGAKAKLMLTPGTPYTNFELGGKLEHDFGSMCGSAEARVATGRGVGRLRTQTITR